MRRPSRFAEFIGKSSGHVAVDVRREIPSLGVEKKRPILALELGLNLILQIRRLKHIVCDTVPTEETWKKNLVVSLLWNSALYERADTKERTKHPICREIST